MPLGRLSKKQIESAYKVLTELQQVERLLTQACFVFMQFVSGKLYRIDKEMLAQFNWYRITL